MAFSDAESVVHRATTRPQRNCILPRHQLLRSWTRFDICTFLHQIQMFLFWRNFWICRVPLIWKGLYHMYIVSNVSREIPKGWRTRWHHATICDIYADSLLIFLCWTWVRTATARIHLSVSPFISRLRVWHCRESFASPVSSWIAFSSAAEERLQRIRMDSGWSVPFGNRRWSFKTSKTIGPCFKLASKLKTNDVQKHFKMLKNKDCDSYGDHRTMVLILPH